MLDLLPGWFTLSKTKLINLANAMEILKKREKTKEKTKEKVKGKENLYKSIFLFSLNVEKLFHESVGEVLEKSMTKGEWYIRKHV